jgi:hypothetical protein
MNHQHQLQGQQPAQASSKASGQCIPGLSKVEYHEARRLIGLYGRAAIALLTPRVFAVMNYLLVVRERVDPLAERADIIAYCQRAGIDCDIRHTRFPHHCA